MINVKLKIEKGGGARRLVVAVVLYILISGFSSSGIIAQGGIGVQAGNDYLSMNTNDLLTIDFPVFPLNSEYAEIGAFRDGNSPSSLIIDPSVPRVTQLFLRHYGFFCKIEDSSTRHTGLQPRFRMGSVDYVNMLEGKTR